MRRQVNAGFEELLASRFGVAEYLIPIAPLSLFLLACFVWIFWPGGMPAFLDGAVDFGKYISDRLVSVSPALAGVVAAYVFLSYSLVRRNNGSDLTPGAFWEANRRLVAVFGLGLILTAFNQNNDKIWAIGLLLVAMFVGIFPTEALRAFARGGQTWLQAWIEGQIRSISPETKAPEEADHSRRLSARHELSLLDDLNEWDVLRLEEANIVGLQGMATADLEHLLTWTPFNTAQLVDWVDQAMLFMASGAEPEASFAKTFRTIGIRRATTLVEMANIEKGKETITLAARAVQTSGVFDPLPVAQLAAARAQFRIREMQEKVEKVKDKAKDTSLDASLRSDIEAAVSLVNNAKSLADQAHEQVKAGGDLLKNALTLQADPLHIVLQNAEAQAKKVEEALKAITGTDQKVSETLANALKALGEQVKGPPDANTRAAALVDELDQVANPLTQSLKKAGEFQAKAEEVLKAAEKKGTAVPASVTEAETSLKELTDLAKKAQERINADASLEQARSAAGELVKELEADGEDKAVKLLGAEALKKQGQWTEEGTDQKAKAYPDAEKLVKHAKEIDSTAEKAEGLVREARTAKAASGASLPLTLEVLETILAGLKGNSNLERIQHYIDAERNEVNGK